MTKVYIDSNYILRLLIADIPKQHQSAIQFFERIEAGEVVGRLSVLVVNEIFWIAENYYGWERKLIVEKILQLIGLKSVEILEMNKTELISLLEKYAQTKVDFTDIYLGYLAGDEMVASFDKHLAQLGAKVYPGHKDSRWFD